MPRRRIRASRLPASERPSRPELGILRVPRRREVLERPVADFLAPARLEPMVAAGAADRVLANQARVVQIPDVVLEVIGALVLSLEPAPPSHVERRAEEVAGA